LPGDVAKLRKRSTSGKLFITPVYIRGRFLSPKRVFCPVDRFISIK
jgi:hypothetical protein